MRCNWNNSYQWRLRTILLFVAWAMMGSGCTDSVSESNHSGANSGRVKLQQQTVSLRGTLSLPDASDRLSQQELVVQLPSYDPGSLLRCGLNENEQYRAAVDALGGVRWDYSVQVLEDNSQPIFQKGLPDESMFWVYDSADSSSGVEIVEADIVGLSDEAALFASSQHGLLLVDLSGDSPRFACAAKLPGYSKKFYYYKGELVVLAEGIIPGEKNHSFLLHFTVSSDALSFVEAIDLGPVNVLDSRRFNERLVIYTDFSIEPEPAVSGGDFAAEADEPEMVSSYLTNNHRQLHVFNWSGATLTEELTETQISDVAQVQWMNVTPQTHTSGDLVHRASYFSDTLWASDRYFVVTESVQETYLDRFQTETYPNCVEYHTRVVPYTYCYTKYETRPNPNYVAPDNTGGDRACNGTTLSDCLRHVATVSNKTIEVPVERVCEARTQTEFICDKYENVQYEVPYFRNEVATSLAIYEYTENGFIRFASDVSEILNTDAANDLANVTLADSVETLTTSPEKFDLAIPGTVQTLYFQNGFLYVIANGILQVYAMGDNSLVRTSTLEVVNDTLETSLFTDNTIYLSDFSWNYGVGDTSQLKLVNLSNPAFPTLLAQTQELPGGHTHILAIDQGIFTIGAVSEFEGQNVQALKLGLFGNPTATELSYLILGTDLSWNSISQDKEFYFDQARSSLFLPYTGYSADLQIAINRVGISHLNGQSIISDGALETPERLLRVRPEPGTERLLGFGNNLIESFTPGAAGWEMQPLLQYYTPIALYRYTDDDDYLEVLQLGNQCRLHFAKADMLNQRDETTLSEPFTCPNWVWAFGQNILFGETMGFAFTPDGTLSPLSPAQVSTLYEAYQNRPYCLLSTTDRFAPGELRVDFSSTSYSIDDFTCMSPDAYWEMAQDFEN